MDICLCMYVYIHIHIPQLSASSGGLNMFVCVIYVYHSQHTQTFVSFFFFSFWFCFTSFLLYYSLFLQKLVIWGIVGTDLKILIMGTREKRPKYIHREKTKILFNFLEISSNN